MAALTISVAVLTLLGGVPSSKEVAPVSPLGCPHPNPFSADLVGQPPDTILLRVARVILAPNRDVDAIWPNYWPEFSHVVAYRESDYLLIDPAAAPRSAREIPWVEATGRDPKVYLFSGTPAEFTAQGGRYARDEQGIRSLPNPLTSDTMYHNVALIFHEQFHLLQIRRFPAWRAPAGEPGLANVQLINEERRLLADALEASTHTELRRLAAQYLQYRERRLRGDEDAIAAERKDEAIEGVAMLIGLQAADAALNMNGAGLRFMLCDELRRPLESAGANRWVPGRVEPGAGAARSYGTGAALGRILDQLDASWKTQMERGRHLDEILETAVRVR